MSIVLAAVLLWSGLTPGPSPVGYRHADAVDIWYPSKDDGQPMTFRDYRADASFASEAVYAKRDATPDDDKHPLVFIAQGNGEDAADQAILSEFLASHGHVVVSVPSPMLAHAMTDESQIGAFAEEQAKALENAKRVASRIVRLQKRESVIGHSFGARSALLLAARDHNIRAIVSLDGGIGTAAGNQLLGIRSDTKLPPLLHIYEELDPFMKPDFTFLKSLRLESLTMMSTVDMHHHHFTTWGFASAAIPDVATLTKAGPRIAESVAQVAEAVLQFIDK